MITDEMLDQFMEGIDSIHHTSQTRREWCRLFLRDVIELRNGPNNRLWDVVEESLNQTRSRWLRPIHEIDEVDATIGDVISDVERNLARKLKPSGPPTYKVPPTTLLAEPRSKRCIVCPHVGKDHEEHSGQMWCRPCNSGKELTGPCSSYFISVHSFVASPRNPLECSICQLGDGGNAHRDEYIRGQ